MHKIIRPRLVPVLCLEPSDFGQVPSPPGPWSAEVGAQYWKECLSQSGLDALTPMQQGSWNVPLTQILDGQTLPKVIQGLSHHFNQTLDDDLPVGFPGGCALLDGEIVVFEPQCCGDLTAHLEWEAAATYREAGSAQLWIGHPWLEIRFLAPELALRMSSESPDNPSPEYLIDPVCIRESLVSVRRIQSDFATQLAPLLSTLGKPRAAEFAQALAGF